MHLLKMCVGVESVEQLAQLQTERLAAARERGELAELRHLTRHMPRQADAVVADGSLYWIIAGHVRARQRVVRIDRLDPPVGTKACALVLGARLVRTVPQPRRPHQGWRYLKPGDAPADLPEHDAEDDAPAELLAALRAIGLL